MSKLMKRTGPGGSETFAWANAAGMTGFETFWHRCTQALESKVFVWPDGVTEVKYPANGGGEPYTVRKPKTPKDEGDQVVYEGDIRRLAR